jgi:hypothetical protein
MRSAIIGLEAREDNIRLSVLYVLIHSSSNRNANPVSRNGTLNACYLMLNC